MEDHFNGYEVQHPTGLKVIYLGKGGYDSDREYANRFLVVGQEYNVLRREVHAWRSEFVLAEFPDQKFNNVMFDKF